MEYISILEKSHLFDGIKKDEIEKMIKCLHAEYKEYEKNETVLWEGSAVTKVGIVLSGHARSTKTDISGKFGSMSILWTKKVERLCHLF